MREFVPLRPVGQAIAGKLPPSFEFRIFWWYGTLVGAGPYWGGWDCRWTDSEKAAALRLAAWTAAQVGCPFMVVDLAMAADGDGIVIECNDAMESEYAGISPLGLWHSILDVIKVDQQ
ncbi:MAG: ATP-grasp domain-containing protein [Candidatus Eremiobacteraeota bacterium]|nr:ATP-grasp domain-containing protein [Candidatus Eremiobacteraeota bacterium]